MSRKLTLADLRKRTSIWWRVHSLQIAQRLCPLFRLRGRSSGSHSPLRHGSRRSQHRECRIRRCYIKIGIAVANAAGDNIDAIAIVGHKFYPNQDTSQVVTPCGRCRQVIFEASEIAGDEVRVLSCNGDLSEITESTISELLPDAFGPKTLGLVAAWPKMQAVLRATVSKVRAACTRLSRSKTA